MRFKFIVVLPLLLGSVSLQAAAPGAYERSARNIFTNALNSLPDKKAVFKAGTTDWFPYPAYSDRAAWDEMTSDYYKKTAVAAAEKQLNYKYQYIPASMYLTYEKIQDRNLWKTEQRNRSALMKLFLGEMIEGKGRFLMQIIDGVYFYVNNPGWSHPQHSTNQKTHRTLPDPYDRYISLVSAAQASNLAIIWYFLHEEFDKIDPSISKMLLRSLEINTFEPYLDEDKKFLQWWMHYDKSGEKSIYRKVNNWTTYCNDYVVNAFLLACQDEDQLIAALERAAFTNDKFMDYVKMDGACEEGPSYWSMAGAKAYDYTKMLYYASKGAVNLLGDEQIRRFGEWKSAITVGDEWLVAFGDGFARMGNEADLVYRFGTDCGSEQMQNLALYLSVDEKEEKFRTSGLSGDLFRALEQIKFSKPLENAQKEALAAAGNDYYAIKKNIEKAFTSSYYPQTEFASLRNKTGWMLGAKGGNNGESHNHNDLGSGVLFIKECPVLIDPGVSTYGPRFYEGKQYGYWNKYSDWHNTPSINGALQYVSLNYYAVDSKCDTKANVFSTDIAHAYKAEEAACKSWVRTFTLGDKSLTITDEFTLETRKAADVINFIAQGNVYFPGETVRGYKVKNGEVIIKAHSFDNERHVYARLSFPKSMTPSKETLALKDPRFVKVWGDKIERIKFTSSEKAPVKGKYEFKVTEL